MPRKPAKRGRGAQSRVVADADGMVARLVDRAFDNPAASGGLVVMALTATAIVSNAMFLQRHGHPEPLFSTRPPVTAPSVPLPRSRIEIPTATHGTAEPPLPVLAPSHESPPAPAPSHAANTRSAAAPIPPAPIPLAAAGPPEMLVADIQRELARLGLYTGSIDGLIGPRTRTAIIAYQRAAGREPTGEATAHLLAYMKQPLPVASAAPSARDLAAQRAAAEAARYRDVQTALNLAGYGPLAVDGRAGGETANAIRRFELDNGLQITGEANDTVVTRLAAIGAMPAR